MEIRKFTKQGLQYNEKKIKSRDCNIANDFGTYIGYNCFSTNENISGIWETNSTKYLTLAVLPCINTSGVNCCLMKRFNMKSYPLFTFIFFFQKGIYLTHFKRLILPFIQNFLQIYKQTVWLKTIHLETDNGSILKEADNKFLYCE